MTAHSALYMPSVFKKRRTESRSEKIPLQYTRKEWTVPLLYMLTLALLGLSFYPALLFLLIFWIRAWRDNRYDLAIMLFLFFGRFAMLPEEIGPIKYTDMGLALSFVGVLVLRKSTPVKKMLILYCAYALVLFFIASYSQESMKIQIRLMRGYLSFISVFIPLLIFANSDFDIKVFFRRMIQYVLLMSIFYIIDAFVLKGDVFVPHTPNGPGLSKFFALIINPGKVMPVRKYPDGIIIIGLCIAPMIRYYKLAWWQIGVMAFAIILTQTFTLICAIIICIVFFQSSRRRIMQFCVFGALGFGFLLALDYLLPYDKQREASTMRIRSSVEQFERLADLADDETLAEFASGRVGQALPILELITDKHTSWKGLGFLHPSDTKITDLIIFNEYEHDIEVAERVASEVEIVQVQVFIHSGWVGLAAFMIFFFGLYFIIRKMKYREVYLSALVFTFITSASGFGRLNGYIGISIVSFAFAIVLLANRPQKDSAAESSVLSEAR